MATGTKAFTALQTTLSWGDEEATVTKVIKITGFPDLGATPNEVDVSTTEDEIDVSILGRQSLGALEFDYFYDNDGENYAAVTEDSNKQLTYVLKFNGGAAGTATWKGEHMTYIQAAEGDDPVKGKLVITVSEKPVIKKPTEGA